MIGQFHINDFISTHVTERESSLFANDLEKNDARIREKVDGKSALVIGGAGTIGSSFIKALLQFNVSKLYVVDTNENGLTELVRDVRSSVGLNLPQEFITYPINYSDAVFEKIFKASGPFEIVANFAAHKHVRSEKDHFSIEAMVKNNVLEAKKLLDLMVENPPQHFFCVSTDKAANPVNVMGASKKLMEDLILNYSKQIPITTARFANVAFSNGSLPFGFMERLMKRQPFSSPKHIKRYFVSPEESGQICLMACILGNSGEIFFPKLDYEKNMKTFSAIAVALLNELGFEADECATEDEARLKAANFDPQSGKYPVYFFESKTSGEKSFEEFYTDSEELDTETFESLGVIKNAAAQAGDREVEVVLNNLISIFDSQDVSKENIVNAIKNYLPNFSHIEKGKNLDQSM